MLVRHIFLLHAVEFQSGFKDAFQHCHRFVAEPFHVFRFENQSAVGIATGGDCQPLPHGRNSVNILPVFEFDFAIFGDVPRHFKFRPLACGHFADNRIDFTAERCSQRVNLLINRVYFAIQRVNLLVNRIDFTAERCSQRINLLIDRVQFAIKRIDFPVNRVDFTAERRSQRIDFPIDRADFSIERCFDRVDSRPPALRQRVS